MSTFTFPKLFPFFLLSLNFLNFPYFSALCSHLSYLTCLLIIFTFAFICPPLPVLNNSLPLRLLYLSFLYILALCSHLSFLYLSLNHLFFSFIPLLCFPFLSSSSSISSHSSHLLAHLSAFPTPFLNSFLTFPFPGLTSLTFPFHTFSPCSPFPSSYFSLASCLTLPLSVPFAPSLHTCHLALPASPHQVTSLRQVPQTLTWEGKK